MKNIFEIMKEYGLEVEEDKKSGKTRLVSNIQKMYIKFISHGLMLDWHIVGELSITISEGKFTQSKWRQSW